MWLDKCIEFITPKKPIKVGSKVTWNSMRGKLQGRVMQINKDKAKIHTDFSPYGGYLSLWIELKHLKRV